MATGTVCGPASSSREARPVTARLQLASHQLPRTGRAKPRDVARHRIKPHRTSATNALARRRRLLARDGRLDACQRGGVVSAPTCGVSECEPRHWPEFVPFLQFDTHIRTVICTTNAIESINARIRRAVNARGHFPTDTAALKCVYLAIMSLDPTGRGRQRWSNRWKEALNAFEITFDGRLSANRK